MAESREHIYDICWDEQGYRIIDCKSCGFKHIYPIPGVRDLEDFYREKYFRDVKPFPYDMVDGDFVKNNEQKAMNSLDYLEIYDKIMDLKKTHAIGMLDIGCGNDLLSKLFQNRGWTVQIVEPSRDAGNYLEKFGLTVYNKPVEEIDSLVLNNISFVNIQFVLEHLRDPVDVLSKLYQLLVPGGIIRVCVPNDFSEGQMAYQEYYQEKLHWVCLPDHINYFTFESLKNLLTKVGFKEVYHTTTFPLEFLLLSGINYYANPNDQEKVGPLLANFHQSFINTGRTELLKKLYEHLADLGLGRSIFMFALKE